MTNSSRSRGKGEDPTGQHGSQGAALGEGDATEAATAWLGPNTTNQPAYRQEMLGLCRQGGWGLGGAKTSVGNIQPMLEAEAEARNSKGEG